MSNHQPSERVVLQRIRNRIIEYLESVDLIAEQFGPFETINQWEDWVDVDRIAQFVDPVFTYDERAAIAAFDASWGEVADTLPDVEPDLESLAESSAWRLLRGAAAKALAVLRIRGKLPEDDEIDG